MKASEVADLRALLQAQQGDKCAASGQQFYAKMPLDPVLDHDHKTGAIRGVLTRGVNTLLGKIENAAPRAWVKPKDLPAVLRGLADYLEYAPCPAPGVLHHTYRTATEKIVRTKVRAKKRRATTKKAAS
jgi:hypothetical protein